MNRGYTRTGLLQHGAQRMMVSELEDFLRHTGVRRVHFAEASLAPPLLAYVTHFPRLSITLEGCHKMEVGHEGRSQVIKPVRGHAVFVPDNAWNKPDWATPVKAITLLFGAKQIGISLVHHRGKTQEPAPALKISVHGAYDPLTHGILAGLRASAADRSEGRLARLLVESLLYSCLKLMKSPPRQRPRKGVRTYESMCLYVQENAQGAVSRDDVARHFAVAPNHVSRLFRREGLIKFTDFVNGVRVNRAKFMLRNYGLSVKEIAASCGYGDTAYFCRMFKKICKVTPSQFRRP